LSIYIAKIHKTFTLYLLTALHLTFNLTKHSYYKLYFDFTI